MITLILEDRKVIVLLLFRDELDFAVENLVGTREIDLMSFGVEGCKK